MSWRNHFIGLSFQTIFFLFSLFAFQLAAAAEKNSACRPAGNFTYRVMASYPHSSEAFTQGLVIDSGELYEGTGLYGSSSLRRVDMATGKAKQTYSLPPKYFGEGIAILGKRIIQLTWKSHVAIVYDRKSLTPVAELVYPFEGWGITYDGSRLIVSDGTATIRFLDPASFAVKRSIKVVDENGPVELLNELEFVKGCIYANVWKSDRIAIINPVDGRVESWLDLSGLIDVDGGGRRPDVLNGIAYDPAEELLYVTGKFWPRLYTIQPVGLSR